MYFINEYKKTYKKKLFLKQKKSSITFEIED
jgi:hypothetical protein